MQTLIFCILLVLDLVFTMRLDYFHKKHGEGLPWWLDVKESTCQRMGHAFGFDSGRSRAAEQLRP